jgi:hypothetical protein
VAALGFAVDQSEGTFGGARLVIERAASSEWVVVEVRVESCVSRHGLYNINRTLFNVHGTVPLLRTIMVVEQYDDAPTFTALIIARAANSPSLRHHS